MKTKLHPLTIAIRAGLESASNPENAHYMKAYMKSSMPYRGVKTPIQRKIYDSVCKAFPVSEVAEYRQVIGELWDADYREERYAAINVARRYTEFQVIEMLPVYRTMIETGAWWDYVDTISAHLIGRLLKKHPDIMKNILWKWIKDDDLWIRRSAILAQIRFKTETDSEMLFKFCKICLHEKVFWIRKAIGWALRDYSKSCPDKVRQFVEENREEMSGLTLREAAKYI